MRHPSGKKPDSKHNHDPRNENSKSTESTLTPAFEDRRPGTVAQRKLQEKADEFVKTSTIQRQKNNTGLPDQLKSGIENLSGLSMDDVKVHYNSAQPAQINAHAYAQGANIHLAPGQEKHLPHEAWHVVQQKQGRVQPTGQLKGNINLNDDAGLEKEADKMGNQAIQQKTSGATLQKKSSSAARAVIQRKVNNLNNYFHNNYDNYLGPDDSPAHKIDQEVKDYNNIRAGHAKHDIYVSQIVDLESIQGLEAQAFQEITQRIRARKTQREQNKRVFEASNRLDTQRISQIDQRLEAIEEELDSAEDTGDLVREQQALGREKQNLEQSVHARTQQIAVLRIEIAVLDNQLTTDLGNDQGQFHTEVGNEIIAVRGEIQNSALTARLPSIEKLGTRFYQDRAPKKINALIQKLNGAGNPNEKFPIVMELDEAIYSWKNTYTSGGHLKVKYRGLSENYEARLATVKLIEHQLQFTRNAILQNVFGGAAAAAGDGGGLGRDIMNFGKEAGSTLAAPGRGSRFAGGAGSSTGLTGELKETGKIEIPGIWSESFSPEQISKLSEYLNAAGAGVNGLGQFFRLMEIADSWKTFKANKTKLNALMLALNIADVGATTAAEVVMAGDNITKLKEGKSLDESTNWSKPGWENAAVVTTGLAQGVFALKNLALGIISLRKAYQRKGIDNDKMFTHSLQGGISLTKAVISGMRTAQSVYKIIHATVPPALLHAIPFVSLALDLIELIESIYRTAQGYKQQRAMEERMAKFENSAHPGFFRHLNDDRIARKETRGVFALGFGATRKSYRRFNPWVMHEIDARGAGGLQIDIDGQGATTNLNATDVKEIKEYEYLSKMQEINQKRKTKGGLDAIKTLVNMTGDILTLAHVAAIGGVALKSLTTVGSLTHSGSKLAQKAYRNYKRSKLEDEHGGMGSFTNVKAYNDAVGGREAVDKSTKQKETEYFRHATYILDRLTTMAVAGHGPANIDNAVEVFQDNKKLLKATGVDYYDFINTSNVDDQVKLLIKSMKSGR